MTEELKSRLIFLADKYETASFLKDDPSKFMHEYSDLRDKEIAAFIAANMAFGKREQILAHIQKILKSAKPLADWILDEKYKDFFPNDEKSFYRIFTNRDFLLFFETLRKILQNSETLGSFFEKKWQASKNRFLFQTIADEFPLDCGLIPHSKESAAKRLNMLLRWLVRQNSPVDLGIWTWFSAENLLIPLDVHVMRTAASLNLISQKSANLKTAISLTDALKEAFENDPVRGDFALFGSGVNGEI